MSESLYTVDKIIPDIEIESSNIPHLDKEMTEKALSGLISKIDEDIFKHLPRGTTEDDLAKKGEWVIDSEGKERTLYFDGEPILTLLPIRHEIIQQHSSVKINLDQPVYYYNKE